MDIVLIDIAKAFNIVPNQILLHELQLYGVRNPMLDRTLSSKQTAALFELNWLFNVTINDISVKYVTAHRCAGRLKKFDLLSGSHAIDIT